MKIMLLMACVLLFSCSKSNVALEDKAPHIKTGQRIDALHAGLMITRAMTEEELLKVSSDIADNYSSSFDWDAFYKGLDESEVLLKASSSTVKRFLALNELACPKKNHKSFFRMVEDHFLDMSYLEYIFDVSKCGKNVPASLLKNQLLSASPESLDKLIQKITASQARLVEQEALWDAMDKLEGKTLSAQAVSFISNSSCQEKGVTSSFFNFLSRAHLDKSIDIPAVLERTNKTCFP